MAERYIAGQVGGLVDTQTNRLVARQRDEQTTDRKTER